ncbi:MAG: hypothetical protein HS104_37945 [Polyangiaceae bacterium]|nr:hypothetical protein [Polyangiaceae bacterium]MBK9002145.1 hypothetical protein [Myxococcales bacterium]MCL4749884.1 hypothetical protein [Myxococcales bacterium]
MYEAEQQLDSALRAANLALGGQQRREASRFASIELRFADRRTGPWEIAAMGAVAFASLLIVVGLWFW